MEYTEKNLYRLAEIITDMYKRIQDLGVPVHELSMNKQLLSDGLIKMKRSKPHNNSLFIDMTVDFIKGQD